MQQRVFSVFKATISSSAVRANKVACSREGPKCYSLWMVGKRRYSHDRLVRQKQALSEMHYGMNAARSRYCKNTKITGIQEGEMHLCTNYRTLF